ncbi:hypothetical protein [Streptomyces sp. NPDC056634]|uniref:hypothetical protein n=1 Tax=Streptomyces sp. NPDC056634 TaxID=3345885 RepID=UPI00367CEDA0
MSRPLISFLAADVTGMVVALTGAPWWLAVTAFGCLALGLGVVALQSVFPQSPRTGSPGGATAATIGNAQRVIQGVPLCTAGL